MPYDQLIAGLYAAKKAGNVTRQYHDGLSLWCYSRACVYDRAWDEFSLMARGLILEEDSKKVIATPLPKFFNVGETEQSIPDLPFETFEKFDGSLIIIFCHEGRWKTATKGSLKSDQAQWALRQLNNSETNYFVPGNTYLCEAIYSENRIVVRYDYEGLVLLTAYHRSGEEYDYRLLSQLSGQTGLRIAKRYTYNHISELIAVAKTLSHNEEGFVLRFANGLRLKIKGDEYRRIHALISRCTPLAMWEAMKEWTDLNQVRKDLPEEFWSDFDQIVSILCGKIEEIINKTKSICADIEDWPDKKVGLCLHEFPEDIRSFIFPFRKFNGDLLQGRAREALFRHIRPTRNELDGYTPSYAMNRAMEESI